ncbi:calcium-binding protein [Geminocystis sp.]|uniref:calcium-binding protein n=1 Tax=Geminocystis sp. TaxID=2664100 RepID=UPI0035931402
MDNTGDQVIELLNEGTDLVNSSVSYILSANVENLTLTSIIAINGTGNILNNRITGNSSDNILNGDGGNDTLIGGSGDDILIGGIGNDSLDGGIGSDVLIGGIGNDNYTGITSRIWW